MGSMHSFYVFFFYFVVFVLSLCRKKTSLECPAASHDPENFSKELFFPSVRYILQVVGMIGNARGFRDKDYLLNRLTCCLQNPKKDRHTDCIYSSAASQYITRHYQAWVGFSVTERGFTQTQASVSNSERANLVLNAILTSE